METVGGPESARVELTKPIRDTFRDLMYCVVQLRRNQSRDRRRILLASAFQNAADILHASDDERRYVVSMLDSIGETNPAVSTRATRILFWAKVGMRAQQKQ